MGVHLKKPGHQMLGQSEVGWDFCPMGARSLEKAAMMSSLALEAQDGMGRGWGMPWMGRPGRRLD